jgi:Cation transporter/ATPase, N-terminus
LPASASETAAHHGLPAHEVVLLLETAPHRGLSADEAAERLERFGPNTLPAAARAGFDESTLQRAESTGEGSATAPEDQRWTTLRAFVQELADVISQ